MWYCLAKTFWGKAGSGILYYCPQDDTAMLLLRSPDVEDPNVWGIPGGALKGTEGFFNSENLEDISPEENELKSSAEKEVQEEIGFLPSTDKELGSITMSSGGFNYTTFIVAISMEEKERIIASSKLNWESSNLKFFKLDSMPNDIHYGVRNVLERHPFFSKREPI